MSLPGEGRSRFARLLFLLVLGAALTALLGVACGGGTKVDPEPDPEPGANAEPGIVQTPPPGATQVNVEMSEFTLTPDVATAPSGQVYFLATNAGGEAHEGVVIKTDLAPGQPPHHGGRGAR